MGCTLKVLACPFVCRCLKVIPILVGQFTRGQWFDGTACTHGDAT